MTPRRRGSMIGLVAGSRERLSALEGPVTGAGARRRRRRRHHHGAALGLAVLLLVLSASSAAAVLLIAYAPDAVVGCRLGRTPPRVLGSDTLLTAADGTALGVVPTSQNREPLALARVSRWLQKATVDVEDRRFWRHGALDPVGVGRSALADLAAGRVVQGASTITQQLVRNRYLGGEPMTLSRKLDEACLAVQLFRRWPRRRILEAYLDTVSYGEHARGAQAAAWTYFSRSAARLSVAQAALIAGLPQAPSAYDPVQHPRAARARRHEVLTAMWRAGDLSASRYRTAVASPLGLHPGDRYRRQRFATFFGAARDELVRRFGTARVRHGGLHVATTLRPRLQRLAQRAIGGWIRARGDPGAALVAIDPHNGDVLAAATRTPGVTPLRFNLATQSRRQAGSAFKTFTLTTALEQGIPLSSVWNGPPSLTIPDRRCLNANGPWVVHNFADESSGTMNLVQAIAHSVNTIYAQVAVRVGPQNIVRTAERMGVRSPLIPVCSITLGPEGVSPLDMADAFATLASGGIHHAPELVRSVTGAGGAPLPSGRRSGDRALPARIADEVTYALSAVIHGGTGTAADPGRPAAGKTGTAENSADAWFCGYVPQLAACVWIGNPKAETTMTAVDGFSPVVGGGVPARIWHDFMVPALAGRVVLPLPVVRGGAIGAPSPAPPLSGAAPLPAGQG
jgi:penicillin-binding protein 1A